MAADFNPAVGETPPTRVRFPPGTPVDIEVGQAWRRRDAPGIRVTVTGIAPIFGGVGENVVWFKTPRCQPTWLTPESFRKNFEPCGEGEAPKGNAWEWLDR